MIERNNNYAVLWIGHGDMEQVISIERAANSISAENIETIKTEDWAWTAQDFKVNLRHKNCIGKMLCDEINKVQAFVIYETYPKSLYILKIEVSPLCNNQQEAWLRLFNNMEGCCQQTGRSMDFMVNQRDLRKQLVMRDIVGWKATKVVRNYFEDTKDDGYLFQWLPKSKPTVVPPMKYKEEEMI